MSLRQHLVRTYLSLDPRSLGLFRIVFAFVLLLDLYWRALDLDHFYTNAGLIPNHTVLWAPPARRIFSLFFTASHRSEAIALFTLCAAVFFGLLVGYRTRLFQVLTLVCLVSSSSRIAMLENGGDVVLNLLAVWTVFLPLGGRFSIDALLASLRARPEHHAKQLADRAAMRPAATKVVSLAVLALILQAFVIYFFNCVHKTGATWIEGTAVHYTLHQDRLVTPIGVLMREHLPFLLLRGLAWATVAVEALGAALIISPFWPARARLIAIAMMPLLHVGFALCLDLGPFSYAMAAFFPLFIAAQHWEAMARFFRMRGPRLTLWFDASCGICFQIARVIARLDPLGRIRLLPNDEVDSLPTFVTPALVAQTIVVRDDDSGRLATRSDAVAQLFRAWPLGLGLPPRAVLMAPGLRAMFGRAYDFVASRRLEISAWLGLGACGIARPALASPDVASEPDTGASRLRAKSARMLREAGVAVLLVAAAGEVVNVNAAVPQFLRYRQPDAMQAIIDYGRLIQNWRMFAPEAPLHDYMISVEAVTEDGRIVDPYNEVASRYKRGPFDRIPPRLGNDQFFTGYSLLIPSEGARAYWSAFEQWILAYHLRTGNPRDRIVRFEVYAISDTSPPPGQREPFAVRKQAFITYPRER